MLSFRKSVHLSARKVAPILNVRFASADCGDKKTKICEDFDRCKHIKVPNQKEICDSGRGFNYRKNCLEPKLTDYIRKDDGKSAWAFEPQYNDNDYKFIPGLKECEKVDECCENIRLDDTMYKPDYKNRTYAKTWLECIEDKPKIKECPPIDLILPEMEKRKKAARPKTATLIERCPTEEEKGKCPRLPPVCCRKGRFPPSCRRSTVKQDCVKRCCPFPSFTECCLENPLLPPDFCECGNDSIGCKSIPSRKRDKNC